MRFEDPAAPRDDVILFALVAPELGVVLHTFAVPFTRDAPLILKVNARLGIVLAEWIHVSKNRQSHHHRQAHGRKQKHQQLTNFQIEARKPIEVTILTHFMMEKCRKIFHLSRFWVQLIRMERQRLLIRLLGHRHILKRRVRMLHIHATAPAIRCAAARASRACTCHTSRV